MKSKMILFIVLILTAGLLSSCRGVPPEKELAQLKVVVLPYTSFGPFFIAQEENFFGDYNLEVEFVRMESGSSPLALLEEGDIDVLGSGPNLGLFNAIAGGSDIRIVADKGNLAGDGCTYMALLAPQAWAEQNQTPTAESLRNLKVSIDPINFEAFMFDQVLQKAGLTLADLSIQDVAPPALSEALKNNAVDIVSVGDPWITKLVDSGQAVIWKPYQEIVPNMQFGVVLFNNSLLSDRPEVGARFMAALLKGVKQYNEGKTPRNLEIMAKYTQLDVDILERACWPPMKLSGEINVDTINAFQTWAFEKGLIEKIIPLEDYWDPTPLNAAKAILDK